MGSVWKGVHQQSGRPVAIKILLSKFARNRLYLEGFHREVRATARLDHPNIISIYDHGVVSRKAAASHPSLAEGSLWLAMEYINGGALDERTGCSNWSELVELLLQLFDALAHAHARDLVHRDLKPGNILLALPQEQTSPRKWVLTDFGIAHLQDPSIADRTADIDGVNAGTPVFMAPEQVQGYWRNYGPWTDLYALGCLTYMLVSGNPPFYGESLIDIAIKHVSEPVPRLSPNFAVPPGFENWLLRLLEKDIGRRYQHAADAAADLLRLDAPEPATTEPPATEPPTTTLHTLPVLSPMLTEKLNTPQLSRKLAEDRHRNLSESTASAQRKRGPIRRHVRPPDTWRAPRDQLRSPAPILGAGVGIFGFRQNPFVGREAERDHLWSEFQQACSSGRPRCVIVEGSVGIGKTRLIQWLATRAEELGLATSLNTTHSPIINATEGLPRLFQTHLRATGLDKKGLRHRLQQAFRIHFQDHPDEDELAALMEWMQPQEDKNQPDAQASTPIIRLDSALERYTLAQNLLQRIATNRPAILCIDDGQWGQDSLGFVHHLLSSYEDNRLPVLVLIGVRPEALSLRLVEREFLHLLFEDPNCSTLTLSPLNMAQQHKLIARLLRLSAPLIRQVSERTEGNPLYATQLIEDWITRDALQESARGYTLRHGEAFPPDIETLMENRINDALSATEDPVRTGQTLELAAALGLDLDLKEWITLCDAYGAPVDENLVDHLMVTGIAVPRPLGWRFRLPLYRDCLERISRREGRWESIHFCCAQTIESSSESGTSLSERRARHFLTASRPQRALPLLWNAVEHRMQQSAYLQTLALLEMVEESIDRLNYPSTHRSRARMAIHRAEALRFRGDVDRAQVLLDQVLHWPTSLPDGLRANAHRVMASLSHLSGGFDAALHHYDQAHHYFSTEGDRRGLARSLHGKGWIYALTGQLSSARTAFLNGYEEAQLAGEYQESGWCIHGVAETFLYEENDIGTSHAQSALELFESTGCRSGMALAYRSLGDFARYRGDLDLARDQYRKAHHFARTTGHVLASVASSLIALCDLADGDFDSAHFHLAELASVPREKLFLLYRWLAPLGLLAIAAHRNDMPRVDELLEELHESIQVQVPLASDMRSLIEAAADSCVTHNQQQRAQSIRALLQFFPLPSP